MIRMSEDDNDSENTRGTSRRTRSMRDQQPSSFSLVSVSQKHANRKVEISHYPCTEELSDLCVNEGHEASISIIVPIAHMIRNSSV